MLATNPVLNEVALRRLEDEAQKTLRVDASGAYAVRGAVAAIRGDASEVVRNHELSIKLDNGVKNWVNYCTSLAIVDDVAEMLAVATRASSIYPDNRDFLDFRIVGSVETASFHEARTLCEEWSRRYEPHHKMTVTAGALAYATDTGWFTAEGARKVLELAREVRRNKGVRAAESAKFLHPDDETFLWSCQVLASPESAAELNEDFADRIAARDDLLEDPGLRFVVMFDGSS